jgi:hypothetical protein
VTYSRGAKNPNPKSETNSKKQNQKDDQREVVFGITASDYGFVWDFEFRASDLVRAQNSSAAAVPR